MKLTLSWLKDHLETSASLAELTDVIPAQAGIHATLVCRAGRCVGARLRGHDGRGTEFASSSAHRRVKVMVRP